MPTTASRRRETHISLHRLRRARYVVIGIHICRRRRHLQRLRQTPQVEAPEHTAKVEGDRLLPFRNCHAAVGRRARAVGVRPSVDADTASVDVRGRLDLLR